jgi:hypothetical protein
MAVADGFDGIQERGRSRGETEGGIEGEETVEASLLLYGGLKAERGQECEGNGGRRRCTAKQGRGWR